MRCGNVQVWNSFPQLECIGGDPFHLVIRAPDCFGGRMSPDIIRQLRAIQLKWTATGRSPWVRSPYYSALGSAHPAFSAHEASLAHRNCLSANAAKRTLAATDMSKPFQDRSEFILCIAAVRRLCSDAELKRRSCDKKVSLKDILAKAVGPACIEYWQNGCRWRNAKGIGQTSMAPGMTGNEGAHFDLKGWVWNVPSMTPGRAHTLLALWLLSQLARHMSEHHIAHAGSARRGDALTAIALKLQYPDIARPACSKVFARKGLSRKDVETRRLTPCLTPVRQRVIKTVLKKPAVGGAKRPAASFRKSPKLHSKEKLVWGSAMTVKRKPSSYLVDTLFVY